MGSGQLPRGVPRVSSLRGREMMRQRRQQLGGVPGGQAEAWALPGRLQVEHRVLALVSAGGCHSGEQGGQAAQLRVAVPPAGPAALLDRLGAQVRQHGLQTCAQRVKLRG